MKLFLAWCRRHPLKFTLLVLYCAACGATLRFDLVWGLVLMALGYGCWAIVYTLDTTRMLAVLLATSLALV